MPETKNYAKVGMTTYKAYTYFDNGSDVFAKYGPSAELPNEAAALDWIKSSLKYSTEHHNQITGQPMADTPDGYWHGSIERGTYQDESYDYLRDANWEQNGSYYCYCWVNSATGEVGVDKEA